MDGTFETPKSPPGFPAGLTSERGVKCGPNEWGTVIGLSGGENRIQRVDGALMAQESLVLEWGGIHPADAACEDCFLALIKAYRDFGVGRLGWIHLPLRPSAVQLIALSWTSRSRSSSSEVKTIEAGQHVMDPGARNAPSIVTLIDSSKIRLRKNVERSSKVEVHQDPHS